MLSVSRSTLYAMIRGGEFPKPIQITKGRVGWISSEVDKWLENATRQRNALGGKNPPDDEADNVQG